jgi:hypothetical protein
MFKEGDTRSTKWAIGFSSGLRWLLGVVFFGLGYVNRKEESAWFLIIFGLVFFATGFIRPRRCIDDNCKF